MKTILFTCAHDTIDRYNVEREPVRVGGENGAVYLVGFFGCSREYETVAAAVADIAYRHGLRDVRWEAEA